MRIMSMWFVITLMAGCRLQPWDQSAMQDNGLPRRYTITRGGNLYEATATICGTNATDEAGRGRWRRWRESDERIARALLRSHPHPKWGTIVPIQPGTYSVPHDLCEDEGSFSWWWVAILLVAAAAFFLFSSGYRGDKRPGPLGEVEE